MISNQGMHSVTSDMNPLLGTKQNEENETIRDNNNFYHQVRCWTLENIENLSCSSVTCEENELLEKPYLEDSSFAKNHNITHPTKESSPRH